MSSQDEISQGKRGACLVKAGTCQVRLETCQVNVETCQVILGV